MIQIPQSFAASIPPLSEAERHIVFAGQVAPHKGVDLLVDAFASLAQDYPDVDLHIIGGSADATFSEYLRQRATAEHAAGRVHFWGFREDVHGLMKQAYVFVQPSRPSVCQETFGRGVVEAMGLGVPSIVLRSGALQELVRHGETGLICDDESVPALAQCLRTFLDNTELRERCADQARQLYVSAYAPHPLANRWRAFLAVAQ